MQRLLHERAGRPARVLRQRSLGVQPENYVVKFPTQHVIRLNIWSEEDYNNIYLIGYPGTRSYRRWFEEKAAACLHNLTQELQHLGAKKVAMS